LDLATDNFGRRLPVAGKALLGLGEIAREWNDLDAATKYLIEGLDLFRSFGELGSIVAYISLARIREVEGDLEGAQEIVDRARKLAVEFDASALDDQLVEAFQAQLWILQGKQDQATRWIRENDLEKQFKERSGRPSFDLIWEINGQTLVRAYLSQGMYDCALEVIEPLFAAAQANQRQRSIIKILAMQAVIVQSQGDNEKAIQILERALKLGEPEGFVRSFLDEGDVMLQLLNQAVAKGIYRDYAQILIAAARQFKSADISAESDPGKQHGLVEPLSGREIEVLQLIANGLSNQEIANQLHISLSTVKGHTSNVYGKLGVHKRTQAVSRAEDLGILP
jgi:LuxR family maltose regulon positive regulatory protein